MAIAGQPDIFEVHVRGLYACLIALNVELIPRGMFNCQIFKPRNVGDCESMIGVPRSFRLCDTDASER